MTNNNYQFIKADKDLFAVYQTIYSQADMEMWYDWSARLNDTKWSDDCYFIYCDDEKIGGAIIAPNLVMFPFLISPFCDRRLFWNLVLAHVKELSLEKEIQLKCIPEVDAHILTSYGVEIWRPRQIMCRPTDRIYYTLDEEFSMETPKESDIPEMAEALRKSFVGGIAYKKFGEDSIDDVTKSINNCFSLYTSTNTWNHTVIVKNKKSGIIVGGCIAGINPKMVNRFAFVDDIFVLPGYRGKGLAEAMLRYSISAAFTDTSAIKLHILIGNPAENLYRKTGFIPGPTFTDMKYMINVH